MHLALEREISAEKRGTKRISESCKKCWEAGKRKKRERETSDRTHEQSLENRRLPTTGGSRDDVDSRNELDVEMNPEVSNVDIGSLFSKPGEGSVLETEERRIPLRSQNAVLVELVEDLGLM